RVAHRAHLLDVRGDSPIVQAELHRPPAFGAPCRGVLRSLVTGAQLDAARVARHAVFVSAPQSIQRLAGRLPDDVPQRDLDAPAAVGVAEGARVLLELEGVRTDQAGLDPVFELSGFRVAG